MYYYGGQAVAKGRVGQQGVAQSVGDLFQRFQAFESCASVSAAQRALRTDAHAFNCAVNDSGEALVVRAEVADQAPNSVSRRVNCNIWWWHEL